MLFLEFQGSKRLEIISKDVNDLFLGMSNEIKPIYLEIFPSRLFFEYVYISLAPGMFQRLFLLQLRQP